VSQLYPRTIEQKKLSEVTNKLISMDSPDGKVEGISIACVMGALEVPSNGWSSIRGIEVKGRL
jgi:hypothetical protein